MKKRKKSAMIRPSGGFRSLYSFRLATVVYDGTVSFCERFLDPRSRTVDQMVQAARSGRQNIAEGSRASASSSQTELRLTNVARASLDELLLDYEDYLRQKGLRLWGKNDPQTGTIRAVRLEERKDLPDGADRTDYRLFARWLDSKNPEIAANALISLIHRTNYLIDGQIAELERQFVEKGGYSENLAAARLSHRRDGTNRSHPSHQSHREIPRCPRCGGLMVLRTAGRGKNAGNRFWGCANFPDCKGTRKLED